MKTTIGRSLKDSRREKRQRCLKPAKLQRFLASLAMFFIALVPAKALDSNQPPGNNFDLSHWYLTIPDTDATIIPPAQLVTGYTHADWFYTGPDGAMLFWAPVTGGSTANSTYPRSELRERLNPTRNDVNWTAFGTHLLDAECRVRQLPSSGEVIIGQIHSYLGLALPLVKLVYDDGAIDAQIKESPNAGSDAHLSFPSVALNDLITYRIKMVDGLVSVTVNGLTKSMNVFASDPAWTNQTFYFKAGAYCLDNSGPVSEGARVAFYHLVAAHPPRSPEPAITSQPAGRTVDTGVTVSLSIAAAGAPPLSYQWRKDEAELPAATTAILTIVNAQTNDSGDYTVVLTNAFGSVTSAVARLNVVVPPPIIPLANAVDALTLAWTTNGSPSWVGQTNVTHDRVDAAGSGAIADKQTTSMQATVLGPGMVSFWWKASSELKNDRLLFYVGSSEKARLTGETDWQWLTFSVKSGSQVLKWTYSKDKKNSAGQDRGWVDEVRYIPANVPTAPIIAVPPASQTVEAQTSVTFAVGAFGSTPLSYQWQFNGNNLANGDGISGATTATLTLANVQPAQADAYTMVVTNAAGIATSSAALLAVTPVVTLAEALDTPALVWTTTGSPPWVGQTNVSYDGVDAARSGAIADGKSTSMQTTVNGPGTLSFWWKVSSEPDKDRLRFYLNGSEQARLTGEMNWEQRTFSLGSGSQVLKWTYAKDKKNSAGQDRGWVDLVEFLPDAAPSPLAGTTTSQLVTPRIAFADGIVVLTWDAVPGKSYQVLYKDSLEDTEWKLVKGAIRTTDSVATIKDTAEGALQRFYQVVEE